MSPRSPNPPATGLKMFWARISEGIEIHQLWAQFRAETSASYELYASEVEWTRQAGEPGHRRLARVIQGLFWAMIMKLSPARRVLFLIGSCLLLMPGFHFQYADFAFDMPNLALFGAMALVGLLALELADRVTMKRDLEIAREIQSWLMPAAPPSVPGVEIAFATRPANTVAGDYYDAFFRTGGPDSSDQRLLIVVADVAGKSIPAALLMATMQASLRTLAAVPGSLLDLVRRLNQYACAQNPSGRRFTTAFLAELEPASGRLAYVNAGHNWPVLRRASGAIERLDAGGLPLGIMTNAVYECGNATLLDNDLLLIFTDGLVEAEDRQKQEYGESRMLATLQRFFGSGAAELLARLLASVDAFVGFTRQHDDITFLILRKTARAGSETANTNAA